MCKGMFLRGLLNLSPSLIVSIEGLCIVSIISSVNSPVYSSSITNDLSSM